MRIIHGKYKGFQFPAFHGDNTRPTSDLVKESLFNILEAQIDLEGITVLDLFAGTGNIGLECLSRGAAELISVDHMLRNVKYMDALKKSLNIPNWQIFKMDAIDFVAKSKSTPYLIFADPPYDYAPIHNLVQDVLEAEWFKDSDSIFVLEHVDRLVFKHKNVFLKKQYGNTSFTCFNSDKNTL
jgi:16S rRNA (guanine(966)-N(2))-methyltransferase RsmD